MTTIVDMGGNTLVVEAIRTGATKAGEQSVATPVSGVSISAQTFTGVKTFSDSIKVKQAVTNVNDTTPTAAELTTAFGNPATLGRGFVGTVDDADGDTNGYIVWCSDASFYFVKGTKAT